MSKESAMHSFWNSFGVKAYDATKVPPEAKEHYPYITYTSPTDVMDNPVSININIWDRSGSWTRTTALKDAIAHRILAPGESTLEFENGRIYLAGGQPFAQRVEDEDDPAIRRYYINITAEFLCQF